MATSTFTHCWTNDTAGIKYLHDALLAVGLTQTADTGQLDLTTAPALLNASNATFGYTVYQWTDAYQSTYPLYMRIEWKTASAGTTVLNQIPFPVITIGTGTNGSGAITGTKTLTTPTSLSSSTSVATDTTARPNYVCFYDGSLAIALTPTANGNTARQQRQVYFIDRWRDLSGQKVDGATLAYSQGYNATLSSHTSCLTRYMSGARTSVITFSYLGAGQTTSGYSPYFMPYSWASEQSTMTIAGDVAFFPPYVLDPAARTWLAEIAVNTADTAAGTDFTVSRFGRSYTYKSLAGQFPGPNYGINSSTSNNGWAMIWQ